MVEVWIDWKGLKQVGTLHRTAGRGRERVSFTYHDDWIGDENAFGLSSFIADMKTSLALPILSRYRCAPRGCRCECRCAI